MSSSDTLDVLIVGAGIAGCCLAAELLERGCTVRLVHDNRKASSSVAGGLINPVSGKRFGVDARYHEMLRIARERFEAIEGAWRSMSILRFLSADDEIRHFERKSEQLQAAGWLELLPSSEALIQAPLEFRHRQIGPVLRIPGAAAVSLQHVLDHFHSLFRSRGMLIEARWNEAEEWTQDMHFQGHHFHRVVFCDGWRVGENPYFAYVPRMFAKGQLLDIEFERNHQLKDICIINSKFFLPLSERRCLYGATYEWNELNDQVEEHTTEFLTEHLRNSITNELRVLSARAGVRPIVSDLKPVYGSHPVYKHIYLFNGLGSKGAIQAPICAKDLASHLLEQSEIYAPHSLRRFDSHFQSHNATPTVA